MEHFAESGRAIEYTRICSYSWQYQNVSTVGRSLQQRNHKLSPHFVSREEHMKAGKVVKCDCPVNHSTLNICQYALAVAEDLNLINEYLQMRWIKQTKKPSNLLLLIADTLPKTGGSKGPPKKDYKF